MVAIWQAKHGKHIKKKQFGVEKSIMASVTDFLPSMGSTSNMITIILYGAWFIIAAGAMYAIWHFKQYNIKFIARDWVNGTSIIVEDRAREIRDENGIHWWRLLRFKQKIPVPPQECINITRRGKKVFECYKLSNGQFQPIKDTGPGNGPGFEPFTTNQRLVLVKQFQKAEMKKREDWKQNLPMMVSLTAFIIFLVVLFVFWDRIWTPAVQVAQSNAEVAKLNIETLNAIRREKNNIQTFDPIKNQPVSGGG